MGKTGLLRVCFAVERGGLSTSSMLRLGGGDDGPSTSSMLSGGPRGGIFLVVGLDKEEMGG
jgi:hypothetical protein